MTWNFPAHALPYAYGESLNPIVAIRFKLMIFRVITFESADRRADRRSEA